MPAKMFRFRVNGRPIRHIFHRFQNVPASRERGLRHEKMEILKMVLKRIAQNGDFKHFEILKKSQFSKSLSSNWKCVDTLFF